MQKFILDGLDGQINRLPAGCTVVAAYRTTHAPQSLELAKDRLVAVAGKMLQWHVDWTQGKHPHASPTALHGVFGKIAAFAKANEVPAHVEEPGRIRKPHKLLQKFLTGLESSYLPLALMVAEGSP